MQTVVGRRKAEARVPWGDATLSRADGTVGTDSIYLNASPAVIAADSTVHYVTDQNSYVTQVEPDGDVLILAGGDPSRQSMRNWFLDWRLDRAEDHYTLEANRYWDGNDAPALNVDAQLSYIYPVNVAIDTLNMQALIDDDDDILHTFSADEAEPTGLTTDSLGQRTGTPSVNGWPHQTDYRAVDVTGEPLVFTISDYVGPAVADVIDDAQAAGTATLQGQGFTVSVGTPVYSSTIAVGNIVNTSPATGVVAEHGSDVEIALSRGPRRGRGAALSYRMGFGP